MFRSPGFYVAILASAGMWWGIIALLLAITGYVLPVLEQWFAESAVMTGAAILYGVAL